jgi:hypothetical protein
VLGKDTVLIEYATIDDELLAFVVTDESVEVVRQLASEKDVTRAVEQFRFQINTLRYGVERMRNICPVYGSASAFIYNRSMTCCWHHSPKPWRAEASRHPPQGAALHPFSCSA